MSNDIFFRNVFELPDNNNPERHSIEKTPIVQHRSVVCAADLVMWASFDHAICPCERGDKISFPCKTHPRTLTNKAYMTTWTVV